MSSCPECKNLQEKEHVRQQAARKQQIYVQGLLDQITALKKEVVVLGHDVKFLRCLEAAGVDNWFGYDYAQEMMEDD